MPNATDSWGKLHTNIATCGATASTNKKTCDGDGNGILNAPIDASSAPTGSNEPYRFWQHLANAGMIEGAYDGISHGSNPFSSTTANSPRGRVPNTIWFVWNWGAPQSGNANWFDGEYGNWFVLNNIGANGGPATSNNTLTAQEAWGVDVKLDDGKPGRGKVRGQWSRTDCIDQSGGTVTSASLDVNYNLQGNDKSCLIMFPEAF